MRAADVILHHTRYGDIYRRVAEMELEEPKTGHMCTIDYNSKLGRRQGAEIQVRPSNMMWPRYLNLDVYYPAKHGSLCSFAAETLALRR